LVHCNSPQSQQRVGVELLEASVSDLNRYKLRKTHQFGSFQYDPGKYYGKTKKQLVRIERGDDDDEIEEPDDGDHNDNGEGEDVMRHKATHEDEMEAPWNQSAWMEELRLRVRSLFCE
jgi:hypothetical protein